MLMRNFLKTRKSVRDFKTKNLSKASLAGVRAILDEITPKAEPYQVSYTFVEQGKNLYKVLEGKGGYAGVMIKAPSYIILDVNESDANSIRKGAYYMEAIITGLLDLGLGSCWISLANASKEDKMLLSEWKAENAEFMLAIGYPNFSSIMGEESFSSRLGIEEVVYKNEVGNPISIEELEQRGLDDLFYYVRFAPSQYNEQPWRYVVKDDSVDMYMVDTGRNYMVEAGIVMYYFESLLRTLSIPSNFEAKGIADQDEYKYIASIQL